MAAWLLYTEKQEYRNLRNRAWDIISNLRRSRLQGVINTEKLLYSTWEISGKEKELGRFRRFY